MSPVLSCPEAKLGDQVRGFMVSCTVTQGKMLITHLFPTY